MLLTRRHPNSSLATRRDLTDLDRFFGDFWNMPFTAPTLDLPATDVVETENDYRLSVELPGLGKDDVTITVQDGTLYLSAEKKQESEIQNATVHRRERSFGKVERRFAFRDDIVADKIEASYKDGVLTVVVPKAEEAKPRTVNVRIS